jgi:outer membrane biosynthesis protein TonB
LKYLKCSHASLAATYQLGKNYTMRLAALYRSLPLVISIGLFVHPMASAQAAALDPGQATELLAKAQSLDLKCNILAEDKSQSLKDYVAQAELSLASKSSVAAARKAIGSGRAAGRAAPCDETASNLVNDVLSAASVAIATPSDAAIEEQTQPQTLAATPAAEPPKKEIAAVAVAEPTPMIVKKPKPKAIEKPKLESAAKPAKPLPPVKKAEKAAKPKSLQGYASVAEKYYTATRCGNMDSAALGKLYKQVLSNHKQALSSNNPGAVRKMLKSAESRAGANTCT